MEGVASHQRRLLLMPDLHPQARPARTQNPTPKGDEMTNTEQSDSRDRDAERWLTDRHSRDWYIGDSSAAEWEEAYAAVDRRQGAEAMTPYGEPEWIGQTPIHMHMPPTIWQRCPVCCGTGFVPQGFYSAPGMPTWPTTSTTPEPCRACEGKGIVR